MLSRHSLHHTDHTCNNKQRFGDSKVEVMFLWFELFFDRLNNSINLAT